MNRVRPGAERAFDSMRRSGWLGRGSTRWNRRGPWAWRGTGALALCTALGALNAPPAHSGEILEALPAKPDAGRRYVIYLHARLLEIRAVHEARSKEHGFYEYAAILRNIADRGFTVISEVRPGDTRIPEYARKVADQVGALIAAGVPSRNITVAGFSKGGAIALVVAAQAGSPDVRFVVMAGCGIGPFARAFEEVVLPHAARMKGRMLSLYDPVDQEAASCRRAFEKADAGFHGEEITLKSGRGHGLFYRPSADWVELVAAWAAR